MAERKSDLARMFKASATTSETDASRMDELRSLLRLLGSKILARLYPEPSARSMSVG